MESEGSPTPGGRVRSLIQRVVGGVRRATAAGGSGSWRRTAPLPIRDNRGVQPPLSNADNRADTSGVKPCQLADVFGGPPCEGGCSCGAAEELRCWDCGGVLPASAAVRCVECMVTEARNIARWVADLEEVPPFAACVVCGAPGVLEEADGRAACDDHLACLLSGAWNDEAGTSHPAGPGGAAVARDCCDCAGCCLGLSGCGSPGVEEGGAAGLGELGGTLRGAAPAHGSPGAVGGCGAADPSVAAEEGGPGWPFRAVCEAWGAPASWAFLPVDGPSGLRTEAAAEQEQRPEGMYPGWGFSGVGGALWFVSTAAAARALGDA